MAIVSESKHNESLEIEIYAKLALGFVSMVPSYNRLTGDVKKLHCLVLQGITLQSKFVNLLESFGQACRLLTLSPSQVLNKTA